MVKKGDIVEWEGREYEVTDTRYKYKLPSFYKDNVQAELPDYVELDGYIQVNPDKVKRMEMPRLDYIPEDDAADQETIIKRMARRGDSRALEFRRRKDQRTRSVLVRRLRKMGYAEEDIQIIMGDQNG